MSWVNIYDISWFFLFLQRYVGQTRKKRFLSICKKIRNKNVLICILIYRHSKRSCYTNRVMMTTWPGHLIKRLFTIKNTVKNIYICQNNLIASVIVETGGCCMVWIRLPDIYTDYRFRYLIKRILPPHALLSRFFLNSHQPLYTSFSN